MLSEHFHSHAIKLPELVKDSVEFCNTTPGFSIPDEVLKQKKFTELGYEKEQFEVKYQRNESVQEPSHRKSEGSVRWDRSE